MAYVAHFNTIIPGYELNTFALGPEDTDTLVKSREARSGSSAYARSLTTFTTQSIVLATITYSNDEKSGLVLA